MSGKILVYGGSSGIGEATARTLVAKGCGVHLVARGAERLQRVAQELSCSFTCGDVRDSALFAQATTEALDENASLSGLVYAVGTITLKPVNRLTDEDLDSDFRINALGAFKAIRSAIPALKKSGDGAGVLLFSTVAVAQGFAAHASISMAKGAVEGLTRALAAELAPSIRVNCIAPSLTQTPLSQSLTSSEAMANAIAGLHALQRLGQPADIAPLAAFLVSREASWITGQIMGVDGGRSTVRTKG